MQCIRINFRNVCFILISLVVNGVQHTKLADNHMDTIDAKDINIKNTTPLNHLTIQNELPKANIQYCPMTTTNEHCNKLMVQCLNCNLNMSCTYGEEIAAKCTVISDAIKCKGERTFMKTYQCRYCYQTEDWQHTCELKANCNSVAYTRSPYTTNCTVNDDLLCLGYRTFNKNVLCNWTGGYRWSTALILSITLGGFGADRFYLGHWQEGIGKLFSFGGLGVWTLIDVILISLHYIGPADGSLYI